MTTRIAINGFGRIGRCVLRSALESRYKDVEVVAINDLAPPEDLAYLFKYDSVHRILPNCVSVKDNNLLVDNRVIKLFSEKEITNLPWKDLKVDIVFECTGVFRTSELLNKHLEAGAKKVFLSAPAKGSDIKTIVYGVNDNTLSPDDKIISIASCTTNCVAPILKVMSEVFGIEKGHMTTVHSYTNDQRILDGSHKDKRRGRSCAMSMIPTSTGAMKVIENIMPNLKGKILGGAIRVPTPNVSMVDLLLLVSRTVTVQEINDTFSNIAKSEKMNGVLDVSDSELVSVDFTGNPHSTIVDLVETRVVDGNMVRIAAWYDNEWGFSHRMLDVANKIGSI